MTNAPGVGEIIEIRGCRVRVDLVAQVTPAGMASIAGHYVDAKGKALPNAGRRGRFAGWVDLRQVA